MQITGERRIASDRQAVWDALNDPETLRACIPGCQRLAADGPDRFAAVVETKIGPIGARFDAAVSLEDKRPPESYRLVGEGKGGIAGTAKGAARVRLAQDEADATLLSYEVDAEVGGRLAQLGGPIIEATAKRLAGEFFANLEARLTGREEPEATADPQAASLHASTKTARTPASSSAPGGTVPFPVGLVIAMLAALLAGYAIGTGGVGTGWLLFVAVFGVVAAAAGWQVGRSGARR